MTEQKREWRKVYVEWGGDPSDDKENYKRYCSTEPFQPTSYAEEVVGYVELAAYEALQAERVELIEKRKRDHKVYKRLKELGDTRFDALCEELGKAVSYLKEGKRKFAPNTTNSDVDCFLARIDKLLEGEK